MTDAPSSDTPTPSRRSLTWSKLDWPVVLGIVGLHLVAIAAPWTFTWTGLVVAIVLYWISGGLGVTLGFHRLLTHRSFKTPRWLEYTLTAFGCLAWQGGPATWVGTHRIHHKHSDSDLDPHTPNHGFTWSHIFWCMQREPDGHNPRDAAKDLLRDPALRLLDRHFWIPQAILAILLFGGGELARYYGLSASGLSWVIWGVALRTVVVYHATWFVNSAAHTWGYQSHETGDRSTNLWWVALIGFGEGWHNNHHAHQRAAAHGRKWYEFDPTYITIKLLSAVGLAWDIVEPGPSKRA